MRIIDIQRRPFHRIRYRRVGGGGGRVVRGELGVSLATVEGLPSGLGGLLACSDLQGVGPTPGRSGRPPALLGQILAKELRRICRPRGLPAREELGVLLAGDLYVRPELDRRGGLGDVTEVWLEFARRARWVTGVVGNHDYLAPVVGSAGDLADEPGVSVLDATVVERDGLRIAGVGGVVGSPSRPNRRSLEGFLQAVEEVLRLDPDLLILHQGPPPASGGTRGIPELRGMLSGRPGLVVLFGHDPWKIALEELPGGTQLCNLHARALVMARGEDV
jgi:Icc protein